MAGRLDRWNAFLHRTDARPRASGPLAGVRLAVKDNLAVQDLPMTAGSRILEGYVAPYEATVVSRLTSAGAHVVGKTNLDEFGCGSTGENSAWGPTANPRYAGRVPGGSSSGSAVAVATGEADLALGTDTGGSIRCPAAFCRVVGLKVSYGAVSRYGLADLAMSLESPGPLVAPAQVALLSRFLDAATGADPRDASSVDLPAAKALPAKPRAALLVPSEGVDASVRAAFEAASDRLRRAGWRLEPVEMPELRLAIPAYYVLNYAEFASAMQRYSGTLWGARADVPTLTGMVTATRALLGREVKRRILLGSFITSQEGMGAWYVAARAAARSVAAAYQRVVATHDLLLTPTMPVPPLAAGKAVDDPLVGYAADLLTTGPSLAGLPALSVPAPDTDDGIGLQIVGPWGSDRALAGLAERLVADWGLAEADG